MRRQTLAAVDDEDHHVGFGDRLLGLLGHFEHDAVLGHRLEAAGVDDQERPFADTAFAVMPVAGQAGQVGNKGITRTRQAIEERGFADVGSTY